MVTKKLMMTAENTIPVNVLFDLILIGMVFLMLPDSVIVSKWTVMTLLGLIIVSSSVIGLLITKIRGMDDHEYGDPAPEY